MTKKENNKIVDQRAWFLCDIGDKVLGRECTKIAKVLQGKHLTKYRANNDCGDNVIVINADKFILTGSKIETKEYYKHTGYIGNMKKKTFREKMEDNPRDIVKKSVAGMLPKNLLRERMLKRLHIYIENDHPHKNIKLIKSL